jgi:hypothetical protein
MNYRILIPALLVVAMTSTAAAQSSEVTGTLSTGSTTDNSLNGTVTTTPDTGSLNGTVVQPSSGGGGGGGGGGGSSSGTTSTSSSDMCSNIAGFQTIIPYGYVQQGDTCVATSVGSSGSGSGVPGVPNTGEGGDAIPTMLYLLASGIAALGGGLFLRRRI